MIHDGRYVVDIVFIAQVFSGGTGRENFNNPVWRAKAPSNFLNNTPIDNAILNFFFGGKTASVIYVFE